MDNLPSEGSSYFPSFPGSRAPLSFSRNRLCDWRVARLTVPGGEATAIAHLVETPTGVDLRLYLTDQRVSDREVATFRLDDSLALPTDYDWRNFLPFSHQRLVDWMLARMDFQHVQATAIAQIVEVDGDRDMRLYLTDQRLTDNQAATFRLAGVG